MTLTQFLREYIVITRRDVLTYCLIVAFLAFVAGYGVGALRDAVEWMEKMK